MSRLTLRELWSDPANWRAWAIYVCEEDPRLIVHKRVRWTGYTLNFAHSNASLALVGILAAMLAPFSLVLILEPPLVFFGAGGSILAIFIVLIVICEREASSDG